MLKRAGHSVLSTHDGRTAIEMARSTHFDAVILDINLPGQSGHASCKQLREAHPNLGILVLSSLSNLEDKVLALELGADDFQTKPLPHTQLLARLSTLLRRRQEDQPRTIRVGLLWLEPATYRASLDGQEIKLTPTEFRLLALFAGSPSRVFERETLCRAILGEEPTASPTTVDVHVRNLRRKLSAEKSFIKSVHGIGYRLDAQALESASFGR